MIRKVGALIFEDKKLLIVRPHNKPFFINPGGKYEDDEESPKACLTRELRQELSVNRVSNSRYRIYMIPLAAHTDDSLELDLHLVGIEGRLEPAAEIKEYKWMSRQDYENRTYKLAPSFDEFIPDLINDGYL